MRRTPSGADDCLLSPFPPTCAVLCRTRTAKHLVEGNQQSSPARKTLPWSTLIISVKLLLDPRGDPRFLLIWRANISFCPEHSGVTSRLHTPLFADSSPNRRACPVASMGSRHPVGMDPWGRAGAGPWQGRPVVPVHFSAMRKWAWGMARWNRRAEAIGIHGALWMQTCQRPKRVILNASSRHYQASEHHHST